MPRKLPPRSRLPKRPRLPRPRAKSLLPRTAPAKPKKKRLPRSERRRRSKPKRERPATRAAIVRLPKPEHARGKRKERRGVVVSSAMDKTIVVRVDTQKPHPVYKKVVRQSSKFHAHDEANVAKAGDVVRIVETRPISKTKSWRLAEVSRKPSSHVGPYLTPRALERPATRRIAASSVAPVASGYECSLRPRAARVRPSRATSEGGLR